MTRLTVKVRGELVRSGLQDLGAEIPKVGRRQIRTVMNRIQKRMSKPGDPPAYPIQWDSDKQRKAFFATDGFGRGIPTKRTGEYAGGWEIKSVTNGYQIENKTEYSKFVGGDAYGVVHSGIHAGRWAVLRDVADEEVATLPDEIEQEIVMVARRNNL